MIKRAKRAGLLPALVVSVVIGAALIVPASANPFASVTPGCTGYGYSPPGVPTVTNVSPDFGPTTGGITVTITGTDFCSVTAVNFGGTAATSFVVVDRTHITAVVPAHSPGTVDVTVTTTLGTSATRPGDHFRYIPPVAFACSRQQYKLTGSDGASWMTVDATNLSIAVTPSVDSFWIVTGNADLWTTTTGFNQDLGITVVGGTSPTYPSVAGQPEAWKESGGFAGTYSPNAAAVETVLAVKAGQTYAASLQWKSHKSDSGSIWIGAGPIGSNFSQTCIVSRLVPASAATVVSKVSTSQYTLTGSNGATWNDIDATNLSLSFTAPANGVILLGGNADLWTAQAGFNQDIAINVGGSINAWKESGGFNGTFSPNAAFVQTVVPVTAASTYTAKLQWKTNKADSGTIYAGAGPVPARTTKYSPTRLSLLFLPTAQAALDKVSTLQYTLQSSDGVSWQALDPFKFAMSYTPTVDCQVILSANADLWTSAAGFNQDIGIAIVDTTFPTIAGQPEAWKESGGSAGTFSPNAAYLIYPLNLLGGHTYTIELVWKTNKPLPGRAPIYTGAGPLPANGPFSPTRMDLQPIGC